MRIIKEMFCALVQYRVKELTNDYNDMDMTLKSLFLNLRRKPTAEKLNLILSNNKFKNLFGKKNFNDSHGTESKTTVCFLRDVSTLLAMVFAARDNFERHLHAEREMIKYCFTFDHINYSRCLTYQHVYLRTLQERSKCVEDLDERGFRGSLSGLPFTSFQTKRSWFYHRYKQTAHIHAKLRCIFTEKIKLQTNSCHKECTPRSRKLHVSNVKALKQHLKIYGCDPFAEVNVRDIITGEELPKDIIENLLNTDSIGNEKYLNFVTERLVKRTKGFLNQLRNCKLLLALKVNRKPLKQYQ